MLKFILGRSGAGKSREALRLVGERIDGGVPVMMIVPDQSTFEYEKSLFDAFGAQKAERAEVFGFSRLCRHCFEIKGISCENVIDDGTRAVIMSLAMEELSEKLRLLHGGDKSVTEAMVQTIENMKKSAVSSADLRAAAAHVSDETLKIKLGETALIADVFDALVNQSYIDPLDDLTRLYEILLDDMFAGYTVVFDGFSGFTAQQLKIVRRLMSGCREVVVTLAVDPRRGDGSALFATSNETRRILTRFARLDGVEVKAPAKLTEPSRFKNPELAALEENIFEITAEQYCAEPQNVRVYQAADVYDECEFAAQNIRKLVIDEGYLYSDITVICHDLEPYRGVLEEVFQKYEIPFFADRSADAEVKPVIRFVNSIFRILRHNFEREDVLALLKTGLTRFSVTEISEFENYLFLWNISGAGLKKEFVENPRGYKTEFSCDDKAELRKIEAVRRAVAEPIIDFKNAAGGKTVREIARLFYELLEHFGVPEALAGTSGELELAADPREGAEQIKIWRLLMETLDKTVAAAGERTATIERFCELLSLQISHIKLDGIPATADSVTVTTAQRVRISKQRASFLIGCIDGMFPAVPHATGIFSQFELKQLAINDVEICDDFAALNNLEIFMAYSCMTSASERVYVSYYSGDAAGASYNPSDIVLQCLRVFPKLKISDRADAEGGCMLALRPAFDAVVRAIGRDEKVSDKLVELLRSYPEYKARLDAVIGAKNKLPFKIENPRNAERLFGERLSLSASQIEKFYLCRFSYFCGYGLKVRERRRAEVNPMEYGTLVHYLLEKFFERYDKSRYSRMSDDEIKAFADKTLLDYAAAYFGEEQMKTPSFVYRLGVISKNCAVLIKHISEELAQSDFDVLDCELGIGSDIPAYTLSLANGREICIRGRVDRVDVARRGGVKYLRVIDYKTGAKQFKLSDVLYGLNLQMLLYLHITEAAGNGADRPKSGEIAEKYGGALPAGILYMPAAVPGINAEDLDGKATLAAELNKKLKMNGLLLNDPDVLHAMDKTDGGTYIPAKLKSGIPTGSLATLEQFGRLFKKIDRLACEMGSELYGGNVQARPLGGRHNSCEFCPYDSVCVYRQSPPLRTFGADNAYVMEEIKKELEAADGKAAADSTAARGESNG